MDKEAIKKKNPLCNRSIFASNFLRINTRAGGGGRSHAMFPSLNKTI